MDADSTLLPASQIDVHLVRIEGEESAVSKFCLPTSRIVVNDIMLRNLVMWQY